MHSPEEVGGGSLTFFANSFQVVLRGVRKSRRPSIFMFYYIVLTIFVKLTSVLPSHIVCTCVDLKHAKIFMNKLLEYLICP